MAYNENGPVGTVPENRPEPRNTGEGTFVTREGERFYRIRNYDRLPPFFMNIVSSSDLWLFLSSSGGLTAGRRNPGTALFPYYTEDKVTENRVNTGPVTILRIGTGEGTRVWEPFLPENTGPFRTERNLYKNVPGNVVVFEERNFDLDLSFSYSWRTADAHGFVRTSRLRNEGTAPVAVRFLDGIRNVLPYGAGESMQNELSCLLDAYKRNELEPVSGVGIFTLSSTMTDLAEPSESLRATVVRQSGLSSPLYLLSTEQIGEFRKGGAVRQERDVRGKRGAYIAVSDAELPPGGEATWKIIADVNLEGDAIVSLIDGAARDPAAEDRAVERDIRKSTEDLTAMVAAADGLQSTGEETTAAHHFANVLYNIMRGGVFPTGYSVEKADFGSFLFDRNRKVAEAFEDWTAELPEKFSWMELQARAETTCSPDLRRLCSEYLPLTFSRRHGDPSRPWNKFTINVRNPDGSRKLEYQGNWRDIFQNWEALALSFPRFTEGMISRFLNAVTADGYNPYRLTRDGFEWEKPDPTNPWANIGYWGDHQIVYLTKLMEFSIRANPGALGKYLTQRIFSHANVPYRIREYGEILSDWYSTIDFDAELDRRIAESVAAFGTDGRLMHTASGDVVHASMTEKLLILLLVKLSNFVPEGGIWMNTQRPEWNDANNALTGKGLSMVTLSYLRRFIAVVRGLLASNEPASYDVSVEVAEFFREIRSVLRDHRRAFARGITDEVRRAVMDGLGGAGSEYRRNIYRNGFSGSTENIQGGEIVSFLDECLPIVDGSLKAGKRADGLYDSYNVLGLTDTGASAIRLQDMLEGQVAILSSGLLPADESLELLRTLKKSRMYCRDRNSYLLYPDRELPGFLEKNRIPPEAVNGSRLVELLVRTGDRSLVVRDGNGYYRFYGDFRNAKNVRRALDELERKDGTAELVREERAFILELFEKTFRHGEFTGRSGTFFAYEGLGSVYWHMVAKLLLAVQETALKAAARGDDGRTVRGLTDFYYDVRSGLGFMKTPGEFGAFPTDPYSHTPAGRGAQQPGMTGQVKEEILTRAGELGITIRDGGLAFEPFLLRKEELSGTGSPFVWIDANGNRCERLLPPGSCAFTVCQVPVAYVPGEAEEIEVEFADGGTSVIQGSSLGPSLSRHVFDRDGAIRTVTVRIVTRD